MKLQLIVNIYLLICTGFGLWHGIVQILIRKTRTAYTHFILFAALSMFLSRLTYVLSYAFYDGLPDRFNVGLLGFAAFFFFIFLANFGQMDLLLNDQDRANLRYRILAMIVPIIELFFSLLALFRGNSDLSVRIAFVIISVAAGSSGYFNLKHLLVPDIDFGIVRSIRGFNLIAFLAGIFTLSEIGLSVYGYEEFSV